MGRNKLLTRSQLDRHSTNQTFSLIEKRMMRLQLFLSMLISSRHTSEAMRLKGLLSLFKI